MYNRHGEKTWDCTLDIYGKVRTFEGSSLSDCVWRYQGQYEDEETGLYYNRFRFYDPNMGGYISQDPIRLNAGKFNLYSYVNNTISQLDLLGLECSINVGDSGHHVPAVRKAKDRPFEVSRSDKTRPTFHSKGDDPGSDHWRLHDAERNSVGPRQGAFEGTDDELFDAYREAYKDLDDIKIDVKSPDGTYNLGTDVTPREGVDLIQEWLKKQGLY